MRFFVFLLVCALVAKALGGFALLPFVVIAFCIGVGVFAYYGTNRRMS